MFKLFVQKPPKIEAVQFDPHREWPEMMRPWTDYKPRDNSWGYIVVGNGRRLHICAGDWIIRDIDGNYSVRNADTFDLLYEKP